jgi:hypothetical protein
LGSLGAIGWIRVAEVEPRASTPATHRGEGGHWVRSARVAGCPDWVRSVAAIPGPLGSLGAIDWRVAGPELSETGRGRTKGGDWLRFVARDRRSLPLKARPDLPIPVSRGWVRSARFPSRGRLGSFGAPTDPPPWLRSARVAPIGFARRDAVLPILLPAESLLDGMPSYSASSRLQ